MNGADVVQRRQILNWPQAIVCSINSASADTREEYGEKGACFVAGLQRSMQRLHGGSRWPPIHYSQNLGEPTLRIFLSWYLTLRVSPNGWWDRPAN